MKITTNVSCFPLLGLLVLGTLGGCGQQTAPDTSARPEAAPAGTATSGTQAGPGSDKAKNADLTFPALGPQLAEAAAQSRTRLPAETVQVFADGVAEVRDSGLVDAALKVGATAIDAELPDAQGKPVRLSALWAQGPVVVVWYRGGWCPYCNLQLRAMQAALPAIQATGGTLMAITPETPDNSLSTAEKNQLEFVVLSDVGNQVAQQYGIVFKLPAKVSSLYQQLVDLVQYNGDDSDELPLAATYVIDTQGIIRYAFLDADYTQRAEPAEIVAVLQEL